MNINKYIILAFYTLILSLTSCEKDNSITPDILLISGETLDLGDVPAGSTGSGTFTVKGLGLGFPISLEIEGDNFSLEKDLFPAANINNSSVVIFSTEITATQGPVSATVHLSSNNVNKTINVIANIVEPEPLEAGEQVYFNNMEFGLAHEQELTLSDFSNSGYTHPVVMATYELAPQNGNNSYIRTNKTSSMCDDALIGDCGNALRFVGMGTSVAISLSGLESGRSYSVSYWVRPDGSTDRSMDVIVTGDIEPAYEYWGAYSDRSFYREVVRTGIADEAGELKINFVFSYSSTSRTISIDNLEVKTL